MAHVHPTADTARWPVGKVTATLHVDKVMRGAARQKPQANDTGCAPPPSVALRIAEVMDATASEAWACDLPAVRAEEDAAMLAPLWVAALHSLSEPLVCDTVDVSLCTHDDRMLQYGRDGVPLCALGDQCLARVYPGNQGPLHVYIPPSVQKLVDDGGQAPPVPASSTCLLCIRRDVHACVLAWNAMVPDATEHVRGSARLPPPFHNLVGVPGGYKPEAFVTVPGSGVFGTTSIVGDTGDLVVRFDPREHRFFFDQSKIKWSPSGGHFLGQGTAAPPTR